jgi:hypothetical protein
VQDPGDRVLVALQRAVSQPSAGAVRASAQPDQDEVAVALAHVLNEWTAIRQFDLELCEIGDAGAKGRFAAVQVSPTLHRDPATRRAELSALNGPPEEERGSDPDRIMCLG